MSIASSKLVLSGNRVDVPVADAKAIITKIFQRVGCSAKISEAITDHLVDANLVGYESHGVMRVMQYVQRMRDGIMKIDVEPRILTSETGVTSIDGGMGCGIPTMIAAYEKAMSLAQQTGLSAVSILNTGHTGRHGAFADFAAEKGFLTICTGGGNHRVHGMVAPHGGARGVLPTNPWCVGIPGGDRGPVVMDFATGVIGGGWAYAARSAGALLPEGCIVDKDGKPSCDPEDYFAGGAILPMGGHKGYALALLAEMIGEAMLGPSSPEGNWYLIAIDTRRYREPGALQAAAEEVLADLRNCPPAEGFERVEIPGEMERERRQACNGVIAVPEATWKQVMDLSEELKRD